LADLAKKRLLRFVGLCLLFVIAELIWAVYRLYRGDFPFQI